MMQPQSGNEPGMGKELLDDAKGVGSTAVNRLHTEVDNRKGDAATQAKSVSSAIESAGPNLDSDAPAWLKSAFTQGAQQVQKFADALEKKDSRELVGEISDFARNSPGTFLTACAAAGFAAARIFQAGASGNRPSQPGPVGTGNDQFAGSVPFAPTRQTSVGQSASSPPPKPVSGQFA